ncbi:MAG: RluA family pseudouridine synthase [Aquabacterium sp.]|uniref:RluA family pseudouridine synthase n=1 Tax=Aquabacterium sp. TaxID=1872578 RepID=UPI001214AEA1|nr:RluA family pseudouridine synthase [Aquabacterium sp.]TAK86920.1 MAG: RluA family pseudouridine synthase [Aquabacterium sp.]
MARRPRIESSSPVAVPLSEEVADVDLPDDDWSDIPAPELVASARVPERRVLLVDAAAHGQRLDVFLVTGASEFSRSHLKGLVEEGCVEVDGKVANSASRKVLVGQQVAVVLKPTAQSQAFLAEPMDLPIVFEDEHLLVVNKPAGLVVHPAAGNWTGTLMNGLLAHHAGAADLPRAGIVHRLDKDTSGLMVVGKTVVAVTALTRAIAAREVSRQYLALAHGHVAASFSVESSIGRDPATRIKMAVVPSGKPARTDVQCLLLGEWAPAAVSKSEQLPARRFSGVLCTLHTGRTHQIRVHLSSRKHPLVADAVYGGALALGMTRQALHAARLSFVHPATGQTVKFEAPLPDDMAAAWAMLAESGQAA